jgi:hypothetical protein
MAFQMGDGCFQIDELPRCPYGPVVREVSRGFEPGRGKLSPLTEMGPICPDHFRPFGSGFPHLTFLN